MRLFVTSALITVVFGACASTPPASQDPDAIDVVASFYPIAEAVERIGGDRVRVRNLTPPGVEPHDLELASDDLDVIIDADIVVLLGEGFQPALEDALDRAEGEVLDLLEGEELMEGEPDEHAEEGEEHAAEDEGEEHALDPHIWLDPSRWAKVVPKIASALADVDGKNADSYTAGARSYSAELEELDDDFRIGLEDCERKLLVTNHAAFGYLAARYGLTQEAISGISPEAEPDPERLAELSDLVEREGVKTIYSETLVSPDVADTLARETGVSVEALNPIEGLTPEQLEDGETYGSVMQDNLAALRKGLGCQ